MLIKKVETWRVKVKNDIPYLGEFEAEGEYYLRPPYSCLYSKNFETLFVRIETESGAEGWGEALTPVGSSVVAEIINTLLSVILIGENALNTELLWSKMYESMRVRGHFTGFMLDAMAACDIALWDLKAKSLGCPLYQLLAGAYRTEVPCYISGLPEPTLEDRLNAALGWQQAGFGHIKIHAGYGVEEDIAFTRQLREVLGDSFGLMVDAHWGYTLNQAKALAKGLEDLGVLFLEAPLPPEDYEAHRELRLFARIDIALGEAERNRFQFKEILNSRAADLIQPDIGRVGITEFLRIAHLAEVYGVRVAPHLSTHHGLATAASIHLSAAMPNLFMLEYQPVSLKMANQFLREPIQCERGSFIIPEGNGLGIELDLDKLAKVSVR